MAFEVESKDLLGRIGRLTTKSGVVETPHLFPVVNPLTQPIPPKEIYEKMGCKAVMTNAYLVKKNLEEEAIRRGIHGLLNFKGVVATDSGAYQILTYGDVEVSASEIAIFQERINSDIAVILDIPTGLKATREYARWTVQETLRRADETLEVAKKRDVLWVGPIQGGIHLDILAESAREISKRPFAVYALGSPTQIMERYLFGRLVDMIVTAKMNLPLNRPLHLFGAGHPSMFALAVALGCDLFDSAAYALYARAGRYLTESGTLRLDEIEYLPCTCPVCVHEDPGHLRDMDRTLRDKLLAEHNLYVCMGEMRRIRQAILEGRLWELVELRAHCHPSLLQALKRVGLYSSFLEKHSPSTKRKGLFYFGYEGLLRPEITRYKKRLIERYKPPPKAKVLVLIPYQNDKPYHKSRFLRRILQEVGEKREVHLGVCAAPFGIVPIEIDDIFPLSQTEAPIPPDEKTAEHTFESIAAYIAKGSHDSVIMHGRFMPGFEKLRDLCEKVCKKAGKKFEVSYSGIEFWTDEAIEKLKRSLRSHKVSC
mgnify:CR=1 FL=1